MCQDKPPAPTPPVSVIGELLRLNATLERIESMLARRLPRSSRVRLPRQQKAADPVPFRKIVEAWHEMMPNNPRVGELTAERRKTLAELWHRFDGESDQLECIRGVLEMFGRAQFLVGKPFASLWWMLEPEHFVKIREGYYDAKELFR